MFLVAGITGQVGGATAQSLLDRGETVRALVRHPEKATDWKAKGVELQTGDLNDADALAKALAEVEGAFLLIPPTLVPSPDFSEAKAVVAAYEAALRTAPPPRLALLSSLGSEQTSGLGNITTTHLMEQALDDLPFPVAFVRAGSFLENYVPALGRVVETGVFEGFFGPVDREFPMVATADIGAAVARLLVEGWAGRKVVEVHRPVTPDRLAHAMGEAVGRAVAPRVLPRAAWPAVLEAMGLPHGRTALYEEMMDGFNTGWIHSNVPEVEVAPAPTTPEAFFAVEKRSQP